MSKSIFLYAFILIAAPSAVRAENELQAQVYVDESQEEEGYDYEPFPVWAGPGWYGGVYINNENDYHYYHQNYQNNHQNYQNNRERNGGANDRDRGEGMRGGGGHGGGGHGR